MVDRKTKDVNDRSHRFVDTSTDDLLKSKNLNQIRPFYQGEFVYERMTAVRKSIYHIRDNWSDYDVFMNKLKKIMIKADEKVSESINKLFERKQTWADLQSEEENEKASRSEVMADEYSALRLYTMNDGYDKIFKVVNEVFRKDVSVNQEDLIEAAVFLIELINIDLFNYVYRCPQYQNFQGIVYRGMSLPTDAFAMFEALMSQPISSRYISVPLGLWSSSKKYSVAKKFISDSLEMNPTFVPLFMKINVLNVEKEYLDSYQKKFKECSVVSSICAVDIEKISVYKEKEAEVLLRGGFYQAINLYDGEVIHGRTSKVLELVMLNSNRDHISTSTMLDAEEDKVARTLFGTMVGVTRNKFILDYCEKNSLSDDAVEYEKLLVEGQEKLNNILQEVNDDTKKMENIE